MEPLDYPNNDPGPSTLMASAPKEETVKRLDWLLSRASGYFGVTNYLGGRFVTVDSAMTVFATALKAHGLGFLDDGSAAAQGHGRPAPRLGRRHRGRAAGQRFHRPGSSWRWRPSALQARSGPRRRLRLSGHHHRGGPLGAGAGRTRLSIGARVRYREEMTDVYLDSKRYRLNVGVVVFNAEGKVWLGRRADGKGRQIWQFPQGGVDRGEDLLDAARRELHEETGIVAAAVIARAPGWITYDFPDGFTGSKAMKGFAGQTQAWFAFRFEGEDSEINLAAHDQIEFDQWRWADIGEAPDLVIPFKRDGLSEGDRGVRPHRPRRAPGRAGPRNDPDDPRGRLHRPRLRPHGRRLPRPRLGGAGADPEGRPAGEGQPLPRAAQAHPRRLRGRGGGLGARHRPRDRSPARAVRPLHGRP